MYLAVSGIVRSSSLDLEAQKLTQTGDRPTVPLFHSACVVGIEFCPDSGLNRPALFDFQLPMGSLTCATCTPDLPVYRPSPIGLGLNLTYQ